MKKRMHKQSFLSQRAPYRTSWQHITGDWNFLTPTKFGEVKESYDKANQKYCVGNRRGTGAVNHGGDLEEAKDLFEQAVKADPGNLKAMRNLERVKRSLGNDPSWYSPYLWIRLENRDAPIPGHTEQPLINDIHPHGINRIRHEWLIYLYLIMDIAERPAFPLIWIVEQKGMLTPQFHAYE